MFLKLFILKFIQSIRSESCFYDVYLERLIWFIGIVSGRKSNKENITIRYFNEGYYFKRDYLKYK